MEQRGRLHPPAPSTILGRRQAPGSPNAPAIPSSYAEKVEFLLNYVLASPQLWSATP
ncbi:hypothetical protein C2845_PM13G13810 [Panicum miliaceum]|uniref:Uncharacterized protein n=1 Tax=Panicum miliaceum TaxID=4540 RepID=A0A3L6RHM5_PANMI|nr:hypothetical protein C2845_PM13G13810 [Panicum miliaceum]